MQKHPQNMLYPSLRNKFRLSNFLSDENQAYNNKPNTIVSYAQQKREKSADICLMISLQISNFCASICVQGIFCMHVCVCMYQCLSVCENLTCVLSQIVKIIQVFSQTLSQEQNKEFCWTMTIMQETLTITQPLRCMVILRKDENDIYANKNPKRRENIRQREVTIFKQINEKRHTPDFHCITFVMKSST